MERLNGEIRDREKVFRDLKQDGSSAIEGTSRCIITTSDLTWV